MDIQQAAQLAQMLRSAQNPEAQTQLLNNLAAQNPAVAAAMKMLNGKNPDEMMKVAQNLAAERGVDINAMMEQLKQFGL